MIPISKPFLGEEEVEAVRATILSGWITQGPKVKEFEENFARVVKAPHACAVSNCTSALHLALLAVGTKPGNLVLTVSHSFIATANAVRCCLAEPLFIDIDSRTYNISVDALELFIEEHCEQRDNSLYFRNWRNLARGESPLCAIDTSSKEAGKISALMVVHQIGMPAELEALVAVAKKFNLPVVEDAACALGSEYRPTGRDFELIGTPHGDIACFSFHPRKVLSTGDGGMLTTRNPEYDKLFRLWRQHGMNVPDTIRHSSNRVIIEEYTTTSFNYRMTDLQAAVGLVQLGRLPELIRRRRELGAFYRGELSEISWLSPPSEAENVRSNWQSYAVRLGASTPRTQLEILQYLLDNGVAAKPGIMNAHQEPPYRGFGLSLPESERARREVVLLPLFHTLEEKDISKIAQLLRKL